MVGLGHLNRMTRSFEWNLGGYEHRTVIDGDNNKVEVQPTGARQGQETLLRKTGNELGRALEGGADLIVAPAKWLNYLQDNWPIYLIFGTILIVCLMIIYCWIRRKINPTSLFTIPIPRKQSPMKTIDAIELGTIN